MLADVLGSSAMEVDLTRTPESIEALRAELAAERVISAALRGQHYGVSSTR